MENNKTTQVAPFKGALAQPVKTTVARIVELIKTGEVDAAYVGVGLKKMAKIFEKVKEDKGAWDIIEEETKKHQEGTAKTFHLHGAKVQIASGGFWDYSKTEDPVLEAYNEIEKKVKELKKLREEYIQNKSIEWEKMSAPTPDKPFGIPPFNLTWDSIPKLIFEEGAGEVSTSPATKVGKDTLKYFL